MTALPEIRASRLPLAFRCAASAWPPKVSIAEESYEALVGRASHEVLRSLVETGSIAWSEVAGAAERHGVRTGDVAAICGMAQKLWPAIADSFKDGLTEVELSARVSPTMMLTGHADLLKVSGTVARIGDWKTGRRDHDYAEQMRGYAALALFEDKTLTEATATVIWIRDGEIENYTMTRAALHAWVGDLIERVLLWDGTTFRPGSHCTHCPRSHECEAANALARRDVAVITDRDLVARVESSLAEMPADEMIGLLQKADLVAHYADRVRGAIKQHVQAHGDVVGSGLKLTIDVEKRRELDTIKAWPVIEALDFPAEKLAECLTISISGIEKAVAKRAGRGNGAAAVRTLGAELEAAGAVQIRERHYLKEKRTP